MAGLLSPPLIRQMEDSDVLFVLLVEDLSAHLSDDQAGSVRLVPFFDLPKYEKYRGVW
jgi:hypothetical protein